MSKYKAECMMLLTTMPHLIGVSILDYDVGLNSFGMVPECVYNLLTAQSRA